jgi:hypothetical protein
MNMNYLSENETKHQTNLHDNAFTENLENMSNEQLTKLMYELCDLYTKHDSQTNEFFGLNEYFRLQIDFIVNYAKRERNITI